MKPATTQRQRFQTLGFSLLTLVTVLVVLLIFSLLVYIFWQGASAISGEFLFASPRMACALAASCRPSSARST